MFGQRKGHWDIPSRVNAYFSAALRFSFLSAFFSTVILLLWYIKKEFCLIHHLITYLAFFSLDDPFFFLSTFMFDSGQSQQYKEKFNIGHCQRLQVKQGIIIFAVVFLEYSIVSFPMTALFFWISCLLSRSRFLPLMSLVFFATVLCAFESQNASPHKHVCIWSSCLMLI